MNAFKKSIWKGLQRLPKSPLYMSSKMPSKAFKEAYIRTFKKGETFKKASKGLGKGL